MRNILIAATFSLACGLSTTADAQHRHQHHHNYNGGWAAPLVGGLIVGGVLGAMASQPRYYYGGPPVVVEQYPSYRQYCERRIVGYDYYGNPVRRVICE